MFPGYDVLWPISRVPCRPSDITILSEHLPARGAVVKWSRLAKYGVATGGDLSVSPIATFNLLSHFAMWRAARFIPVKYGVSNGSSSNRKK